MVRTAIVLIRVLVEGDRLSRLYYYLHLLQWFDKLLSKLFTDALLLGQVQVLLFAALTITVQQLVIFCLPSGKHDAVLCTGVLAVNFINNGCAARAGNHLILLLCRLVGA